MSYRLRDKKEEEGLQKIFNVLAISLTCVMVSLLVIAYGVYFGIVSGNLSDVTRAWYVLIPWFVSVIIPIACVEMFYGCIIMCRKYRH